MLTFNVFDATFEYDPQDPEPFRGGQNRFGPKLGARQLGATVYELPPGQSVCPYHRMIEFAVQSGEESAAGRVSGLEQDHALDGLERPRRQRPRAARAEPRLLGR